MPNDQAAGFSADAITDADPSAHRPGSGGFLQSIRLTLAEPRGSTLVFEATTGCVPWPKAYGGDLLAQAVTAGQASVGAGRVLHSMHSHFLRPATVAERLTYEVELTRDGRSYSTRRVSAFQGGREIFVATLSFQLDEVGVDYSPTIDEMPGPDDLPGSAEYLAAHAEQGHDLAPAVAEYWAHGRSFDQRHSPGPVYLATEPASASHQAVWVKAFDALPDEPGIHRAALAYVSDYTILEPSLRAVGASWSDRGLVTASLDNAIWFHRQARADEWLLYLQEAESVQGGRGLNRGRFFDRSGRLIATVMQEGMLRTERGIS